MGTRTLHDPEPTPHRVDHDLTLSAMTLRGTPMDTRLDAAAAAGFNGIGLRLDDYRAALAHGWTDEAIREHLDHHGLRVTEVEFVTTWAESPEPTEDERAALHIATTFGAARVHAGLFEHPAGVDRADRLARLDRRAGQAGVRIALEFMPYSVVGSLSAAHTLVDRSRARHTDLLIDAWHWHRAGTETADLATIPPERVAAIQLCDCLPRPHIDLRRESRHHRLLPGMGSVDLTGMLRALYAHGVTAPMAVEVLSDSLDALPPKLAAQRAHDTAQRVLDRASAQHRT